MRLHFKFVATVLLIVLFSSLAHAQARNCAEAQTRLNELRTTVEYGPTYAHSWAEVTAAFGAPSNVIENKPLSGYTILTYTWTAGCSIQVEVGPTGKLSNKRFSLTAAALGAASAPVAASQPATPRTGTTSNAQTSAQLLSAVTSFEQAIVSLQQQMQTMQTALTQMQSALGAIKTQLASTDTPSSTPSSAATATPAPYVFPNLELVRTAPVTTGTIAPFVFPNTSLVGSGSSPTTSPTKPPAIGCAENGSCFGDISEATGKAKTVAVKGYYRKDGTYVRGHYRSK